MEANMYEDALKAIEGMTKIFFHSKDEFIEWLAARNPKWGNSRIECGPNCS